jgi:hypothetical protein
MLAHEIGVLRAPIVVKLAQRSLPFFSVLWGSAKVEWGPKQQKAFDDLK